MFFKSFMAIACTSFVVATSARAQEFPSKHVTLMMPYAAGGPGDTLTRIIGQGMGKVLGRVFLVENVAGAGGTLGTAKVAASAPDGYSLLVMHFGHAANTALYRNLRYDPIKDFEPIGMIVESPMVFVARKDFPARDFNDFVAHVKTNREKVVHGHAGVGSLWAPKGTPKSVIDTLSAALQKALKDPDVSNRLAAAGAETVSSERAQPEALRAHLKSEIDRWTPIIKKAGVSADW